MPSAAKLSNARFEHPIAMKIGRYEVLDEIGHGAMGTVWRARDPLIERTVAIKTVALAQLRLEEADAETRFLREAQSAGRLSHPNIVTIYDVGETEELAYIAMEYLPGATLRDVMNKRAPMPLDLVIDTTLQMAEALAFAHEHGVIHRDIKPANVVVTGRHGRIKLMDFGIAHLTNSGHTLAGQMLGSPRYMSPEQAMGKEVDGRSDIFSLGAVLYEMLTGTYAFNGDSLPTIVYRVIHEIPAPAAARRSGLPAGLAVLLARMLNKDPEARPDARTLAGDLQALAADLSHVPAAPASNRVPRLLPVFAFTTPLGVFLLIGLSMIVIEHFMDASSRVVQPPVRVDRSAQRSTFEPPRSAPAPEDAAGVAPPPAKKSPDPEPDAYLAGLDKKQVELRIRRTELLLEYTDQYPDVVKIDRQLELLRDERRNYLRRLQKSQKK